MKTSTLFISRVNPMFRGKSRFMFKVQRSVRASPVFLMKVCFVLYMVRTGSVLISLVQFWKCWISVSNRDQLNQCSS
jgi:hypothetical protein